ncbi:MAG: LL-diaminopimelate aminotransferase [Armatimonadetes bacterium]|nr:LL-diaminopimelate aminotransferase [Armatimonadota bacterium]MDE2207188.1 LL-diaminopimelate aminotransferase [Armatimonadota bacterium]
MPTLSKRLSQIPPYLFTEISALKRQALADGKDVIDLGIGDPDQPTPEGVVAAMSEAIQNPETHRYDESPAGSATFLNAATEWMRRRFGVTLDPVDEAMLLIGSKEGLAHLAWAYIDPGDLSLIPDPAYPVYGINSALAGGECFSMPLTEANGFLPDLSAIPSDVAKRARVLWLNYPNNPTGAVATPEFFAEAVAFAREYDLLAVNDAAYAAVAFDGYRPPSILQSPGARDCAIELHSLSKTLNMTGWRIGFAVGNRDAIGALNKLKSNIDSRQFGAISQAAAHGLLNVENDATLELYRRRRNVLCDGLNAIGWPVRPPQATFYVWARIPTRHSSREFARLLLEEAAVNVIPGSGYGTAGEGYVRISLTVMGDCDGERLAEAVRRIDLVLRRLAA